MSCVPHPTPRASAGLEHQLILTELDKDYLLHNLHKQCTLGMFTQEKVSLGSMKLIIGFISIMNLKELFGLLCNPLGDLFVLKSGM